jgi:hypothetical protein
MRRRTIAAATASLLLLAACNTDTGETLPDVDITADSQPANEPSNAAPASNDGPAATQPPAAPQETVATTAAPDSSDVNSFVERCESTGPATVTLYATNRSDETQNYGVEIKVEHPDGSSDAAGAVLSQLRPGETTQEEVSFNPALGLDDLSCEVLSVEVLADPIPPESLSIGRSCSNLRINPVTQALDADVEIENIYDETRDFIVIVAMTREEQRVATAVFYSEVDAPNGLAPGETALGWTDTFATVDPEGLECEVIYAASQVRP